MLINILMGLLVIGITVTIQASATHYWLKRLHRHMESYGRREFQKKVVRILISTSVFLIFIHIVQASLWAILYLKLPGIVEFDSFEKAIYFSLVTFTTLGYGEITVASSNRILSGLEAINGIMMIGWSTAFMFSVFQEVIKRMYGSKK